MSHSDFHFSITCRCDDLPLIYCLRSITHFAERHAQKNIAWSNTGDKYWKEDDHCVTFRFTDPEFRQMFRDIARDLFNDKWEEIRSNNDDPALTKPEFKFWRGKR